MKNFAFIIFVVLIITSCNKPKIDIPEITKNELFKSIEFLASDSLKGRKPGTPEDNVAASYIADQLLDFGFLPLTESPFQYFEVITEITTGQNNALAFNGETAKINEDFIPFNFSANAEAIGKLAFCGYGFDINTDSIVWNDFEGIDLNGKWALLLRADPDLDNPDSEFIQYTGEEGKVLNAKDRGAIGVLFVSSTKFDAKDVLSEIELDQSMSNFGIPALHIKRNIADKMLEKSGFTVDMLESKILRQMSPYSFDTDIEVIGKSDLIHKKVNTQNVVVWLPANNKSEEYVLFGAHYDHLGLGGANSGSRTITEKGIHYGADDNASGVASMIEIAEKLASNKNNLRRNVIIIAFAAEEIGLLGSKYFTANTSVELHKIKAMINIDMVGRLKPNNDLLIGGSGTAKESESILDSLNRTFGFSLSLSPGGFGPSDHATFYAENIPVFFFSTGAHADYHTPRDVVDSINFEGLVKVADYIYDLGITLLTNEKTLNFQESGSKGKIKRGRKSKAKLGIMPNFGESDNTGLRVDAVTPNAPADLAGMQKGDVIVAIEGKEIHNIYEYMERMSKFRFGQTVNVDVMRNGERKILLVQLEEIE